MLPRDQLRFRTVANWILAAIHASAGDVERGRALLDKLAKRAKSRSLKRDLAIVRKQLDRSGGKSVAKVLKQRLG